MSRKKVVNKQLVRKRAGGASWLQGPVGMTEMERKRDGMRIYLLADVHEYRGSCKGKSDVVRVEDFIVQLAKTNPEKTIDVYLEAPFVSDNALKIALPLHSKVDENLKNQGYLFNDTNQKFAPCLKKEKKKDSKTCVENARFHYVDVRRLGSMGSLFDLINRVRNLLELYEQAPEIDKEDPLGVFTFSVGMTRYALYEGDEKGIDIVYSTLVFLQSLKTISEAKLLEDARVTKTLAQVNERDRGNLALAAQFLRAVSIPEVIKLYNHLQSALTSRNDLQMALRNARRKADLEAQKEIQQEIKEVDKRLPAMMDGVQRVHDDLLVFGAKVMDIYTIARFMKTPPTHPEHKAQFGVLYAGIAHIRNSVKLLGLLGFTVVAEAHDEKQDTQCLPLEKFKQPFFTVSEQTADDQLLSFLSIF